jgi:spermidine synthase
MVFLLPELQFVQVPAGGTIVDYREGVMASVAVVRDAKGDRTLKVNNRFQMGGTSAAATEYRQAHFPLKLHGQSQRALFLGTGTGITFGAATLYPRLEADGVELLAEVVDVMHHFKPENFLDQYGNRLHMHVADARRFVKTTHNAYDVIVADLFHPSRDGAGTLYTKEHFVTIRARLKPSGIFCQWLPLHQMDGTMLRTVSRTFLEVFPNARAYLLHWSVDVPVLGLIGTEQWPSGADRVTDDPKISGGFIAGPDALRRFSGDAPLNTDDHQVLTYVAARFAYQQKANSYDGLLTVLKIEGPPTDFLKARNVYLQGLIHETEGRLPRAIEHYLETVAISDTFTMGYSRCISLAASQAKDRPEAARALLQRLVEAKPKEKLAGELLERLFPARQK